MKQVTLGNIMMMLIMMFESQGTTPPKDSARTQIFSLLKNLEIGSFWSRPGTKLVNKKSM